MNPLLQLDRMLYELNKPWAKGNVSDGDIVNHFKKEVLGFEDRYDIWDEQSKVINKLVKDGYVDSWLTERSTGGTGIVITTEIRVYTISFEGRVLLSQGGYKEKSLQKQKEQNRIEELEKQTRKQDKRIANATIFAAVFAMLSIVVQVIQIILFYKESAIK